MSTSSRRQGTSLLEQLEESIDSGASWLVRVCARVESSVGKVFGPIGDDLQSMRLDLAAAAEDRGDERQRPGQSITLERIQKLDFLDIFSGRARRQQGLELDAEGAQDPQDPEELEARQQLVVGGATLALDIAGVLVSPALSLLAAAGNLYQVRPFFKSAYRAFVEERRVNVYALNLIMFAGVAASGAHLGLTLGISTASFLRWILAKTEGMARRSVTQVFSRHPRFVWISAGGAEVQIPFDKVQIGDVIVVGAGEMLHLDGVVVSGTGSVDQRALTGESQPVDRGPGDAVLSSSVVLRGRLHVRVERSGDDTVAAQIGRMLADTDSYKQSLGMQAEQNLDRVTVPYLALGALTVPFQGLNSGVAVLWSIPGYRMMFFGPLTMLSFMHLASQRGILIKSGRALEQLYQVDTVVFDKTGTLTLDQPAVGQIHRFADVDEDQVLSFAAAAERGQSHPIALAIQRRAERSAALVPPVELAEVTVGFGVCVTIGGERVLVGSERLMAYHAIDLGEEVRAREEEAHERGSSLVFVARGDRLVGAIEICPAIREEAGEVITALKRWGKEVIIISGDHAAPTRSLAERLGVDRHYAQVLPEGKLEIVRRLKKEGKTVCFIGDGLNDAVAMQGADVSVSMRGASAVATTVAQAVLMSGDLKGVTLLFDMADRFEKYMRVNRIATTVPSYISAAGALLGGWGFTTAVMIGQVSTLIAPYSLFGPAIEYQAEEAPAAEPERRDPFVLTR